MSLKYFSSWKSHGQLLSQFSPFTESIKIWLCRSSKVTSNEWASLNSSVRHQRQGTHSSKQKRQQDTQPKCLKIKDSIFYYVHCLQGVSLQGTGSKEEILKSRIGLQPRMLQVSCLGKGLERLLLFGSLDLKCSPWAHLKAWSLVSIPWHYWEVVESSEGQA